MRKGIKGDLKGERTGHNPTSTFTLDVIYLSLRALSAIPLNCVPFWLPSLTVLELGSNPITDWSPVAHVEDVVGRP